MAGRQLAQDAVDETAAFLRSLDGVPVGKPLARSAGHGGTITAPGSLSVMKITFPVEVLAMMRAWPPPQASTATTWW